MPAERRRRRAQLPRLCRKEGSQHFGAERRRSRTFVHLTAVVQPRVFQHVRQRPHRPELGVAARTPRVRTRTCAGSPQHTESTAPASSRAPAAAIASRRSWPGACCSASISAWASGERSALRRGCAPPPQRRRRPRPRPPPAPRRRRPLRQQVRDNVRSSGVFACRGHGAHLSSGTPPIPGPVSKRDFLSTPI
jgi:hypothetical protein